MKKPKKISTGIQVREHLQKHSPDYVYSIWHRLHIEEKSTKMRYNSFCAFFKTLEKLGLVVRTKAPHIEPPATRYQRVHNFKSRPRQWYTVNPRKLNSEAWLHPQRALYPAFFKVTGRRKGRPPGSPNKPKPVA